MNFSKHWAATLDDYAIDLAWSPDGKILAAASTAGTVSLFEAATGALRHALVGHDDGTNALSWSATGVLLATGGQDGKVKFWNPSSGSLAHEYLLGTAWVEHLAWQPVKRDQVSAISGQLLFASAGKKLVALRADGSLAHAFPDAPKTITALAWRADGAACAVAYFGGVCVWDATTFAVQKEFPYGNTIHALTWSPDGKWLVAGCQDNAVHLWVPSEDNEFHMSGYETKLKELSFSHDGKWLATGGGKDGCVWDCSGAGPEGREPMMLPHQHRVCAVAFQHQHSLLATAATNGEFCLWSPSRKNPLVAEVKMPSAATRFTWVPDDSLLAVGTEKGNIFVFKTA
ncbi:WD40 repeat domain-containing protein [Oleiharenicola lentus]|uniref:WD40 repeat domain-containing protein n=1 Tax=Oleiharenicola lentus TaxID=2508720 RepID=UPI003F673417